MIPNSWIAGLFILLCSFGMTGCLLTPSEPEKIFDPADPPRNIRLPSLDQRNADPILWLTLYYQKPDPSRIAVVLKQLQDINAFEASGAQDYVTAFLITLIRTDPVLIGKVLSDCDFLEENGETIIASALWLAKTPESRDLLKSMARRNPAYGRFLGMSPPDAEIDEITDTPGLNIAWGYFHSTGELRYLNLILECLNEKNYRKHQSAVLKKVNQLAVQMLADNCVSDPLVLLYCKKFRENCPSAIEYDLDRVIAIANNRIRQIDEAAIKEKLKRMEQMAGLEPETETKPAAQPAPLGRDAPLDLQWEHKRKALPPSLPAAQKN